MKQCRLLSVMIFLIFAFILFLNCEGKLEKENSQLKVQINQLYTEIDSLKSIISELQKTDSYFFQMGAKSRQNKKYRKSNRYLNELVERFPKSDLAKEAKTLIFKNNVVIAQNLYDSALVAQKAGQYYHSTLVANELIKNFPKSKLVHKAKNLKNFNRKKIKELEEENLKRGSDLELITWSWSRTGGGSYVEAKGQVKNISGQNLQNVEAVASFFDGNGNFITSSDALIDYNPILAGQVSPFHILETYNPAMKKARIEFKYLMGGTIPTYYRK